MEQAATNDGVALDRDADLVSELADFLGAADEQLPEEERRTPTAEGEEEATGDEVADADPQEETDADEGMEPGRDDADTDEEVDETSDEDQPWMPQSLDELAEALEKPLEEVESSIKVKVKVDGQEGEATLGDLKKSYQLEGTLNKRLEALANERKQFHAHAQSAAQELHQKLEDAQSWAETIEQMVLSEYQSINWSELKENDPTEYLLTQQRMQQQWGQASQIKKRVEERRQQQQQEQMQQTQQQLQGYLQDQMQRLQAAIPDVSEVNATLDYLRGHGVTDQEIQQITDHRVVVMANKARQFDQMKSKADPKTKQMKKKPKFVPPGKRKDSQESMRKRTQTLQNRAKKLQTDEAWAEALEARLFS